MTSRDELIDQLQQEILALKTKIKTIAVQADIHISELQIEVEHWKKMHKIADEHIEKNNKFIDKIIDRVTE